ncbi:MULTISPECIES: BTAD domain-containing putative transcriptional regulator [unclassified Isoptericola]|uniref:AfsR/SARP family transcriptional regulator n=1 Tax=unclassified Isoptericola TaxID=2623355 RepID=UPI002713A7D2|nr:MULTISPECIES: BTAD domain-containing putative transcriptional regulator [unclassified Isoptericola]MDO8149676.1 BTAD domain-containing putative transcriptional regulator [Isoptericola sp. b515]MDO8152611.1 BTAD domain-containing putative transcriptional regulator [Isoptericola sp. b408]
MSQQKRTRSPSRPAPVVAISLLGPFGIDVDGEPVSLPVGAQRLVAMLALRGRLGRSRLAGMLWPDTQEQRALASLRTGIWRVNQAAPGLVAAAHGVVELGLGPDVDVDRLIAASRTLLGDPDARVQADEGAPELGGDELLPDWDDPWLETERERLHQLRLHVLEATAARLAAAGRFGLALEAALAALRADELRESAHRTVISIHLAEGNVGEACRAYDACCTTLRTELGIEPSPTVSGLLGAVAAPPQGAQPSPRRLSVPGR